MCSTPGKKCDRHGNPISTDTLPDPIVELNPKNLWEPFNDEVAFRLPNLIFKKAEMSQPNIDELMDLWYLDVKCRFDGDSAPFAKHTDLLQTIDAIKAGGPLGSVLKCKLKKTYHLIPPNGRRLPIKCGTTIQTPSSQIYFQTRILQMTSTQCGTSMSIKMENVGGRM